MKTGKQVFQKGTVQRTVPGMEKKIVDFLIREQYLDAELWKKFVDQFRLRQDGETKGWRGEFWGKSMRGAAMIYEVCRDESLYRAMTDSVRDMLTVADPDGKVTTYAGENEFRYWDVWCRKYVILAMEYYYGICRDEDLKRDILRFTTGCADDILRHIGDAPGKVRITDSCRWKGVNSSSILEPMVRLYRLTGEKRYFDFAAYIIGQGGAEGIDIFRLALENEKAPYQYGVTKAYEMISCFEGIVEYYLTTGDPKYRDMAVRFGDAVAKTEVTVIGSCGCTHELFDHSAARQTAHYDGVMQETCVTVTWMKFCSRLLCLTGDAKYADLIERSWFNAYLGAVNDEKKVSGYLYEKIEKIGGAKPETRVFPFDSYSPLTAGARGEKVGGLQFFADGSCFGCCAAIAGAGVGTYLNHAVLNSRDGIVVNFYQNGTFQNSFQHETVTVRIDTEYPVAGTIRVRIEKSGNAPISLRCRIPAWSKQTGIRSTFGEASRENGYAVWQNVNTSGTVELELDLRIRAQYPEKWDSDTLYVTYEGQDFHCTPTVVRQEPGELDYLCLQRGPIVLCVDSRLGKPADAAFDFDMKSAVLCDGKTDAQTGQAGIDAAVVCRIDEKNGVPVTLVDYASAGKDWKTMIAAWIRRRMPGREN